MREWVTADTHFNHFAVIDFTDRPFKNVNAMNTFLVERWNELIAPRDIVYHVGDFGWGDVREILDILNGQIVYIHSLEWTHERSVLRHRDRFKEMTPLKTIQRSFNREKIFITFCHYAMNTWPKAHYNSWHLFGHSHGRFRGIGKSHDVGVDNNNLKPLSLDKDIPEIMAKKRDNPAYLALKKQKSRTEIKTEKAEDEKEKEL